MFLPIVVDEKIANEILHALFNNLQKEAIIKLLKNLYADSTLLAINPTKWYRESTDTGTNTSVASGVASVTIATTSSSTSNFYCFSAANSVGSLNTSSSSVMLASASTNLSAGLFTAVLSSSLSVVTSSNTSSLISSLNSSLSLTTTSSVQASSNSSLSGSISSVITGSNLASITNSTQSGIENSASSTIVTSISSNISASSVSAITNSTHALVESSFSNVLISNSLCSNVTSSESSTIDLSARSAIISSRGSDLLFGDVSAILASENCDAFGTAALNLTRSAIIACENFNITLPPSGGFEEFVALASQNANISYPFPSTVRNTAVIACDFLGGPGPGLFNNIQNVLVAASNNGSAQHSNNTAILASANYNTFINNRTIMAACENSTITRANNCAIIASQGSTIFNPAFTSTNMAVISGQNNYADGNNCLIAGSNNVILGYSNVQILGSNNFGTSDNSVLLGNNGHSHNGESVVFGFATPRSGPQYGKVQKIEYANSLVTNTAGTFPLPGAIVLSPVVAQGGSHVFWHVEVVVNAISSDGLNSASFVRRRLYRRQFLPILNPITPVDAVLNVSQRGSAANAPPAGWAATINHDTTANTVRVEVTAPAGVTIYWDAFITIYQTVLP